MKLKITLIALLISASVATQAQTNSAETQTKQEMTAEMQLIVKGLQLEGPQIQELGQMMENQRIKKEELVKQANQIKAALKNINQSSENELKEMLTPTEWQKYQSEIKPQLEQMQKEQLKKLEN